MAVGANFAAPDPGAQGPWARVQLFRQKEHTIIIGLIRKICHRDEGYTATR